jgi:hypothetical protein
MVQALGIPKYRTTCYHKLVFTSGPPPCRQGSSTAVGIHYLALDLSIEVPYS